MSTKFVDIEVDELDEQIIEEPETKIETILPSDEEEDQSDSESLKEESEHESDIDQDTEPSTTTREESEGEDFDSFSENLGKSEKAPPTSNEYNRNKKIYNKRGGQKTRGTQRSTRGSRTQFSQHPPNQRKSTPKSYNQYSDPFPEDAKNFILKLFKGIKNKEDISYLYESWHKTSIFKNSVWPSLDLVKSVVDDDGLFMTLYQEIFYRHQFASENSPNFESRFNSWKNYISLFNFLKKQNPKEENLPLHWIWDIINEFVYQWQAFSQYRCAIKNINEIIRDHLDVWDTSKVILTLMDLMQVSEKEKPSNLIKYLGYFGSVGLFRVNCLLGDYSGALDAISSIELNRSPTNQKPLYQSVPSCFVTLFYHIGVCKMMTREYSEAIKTFTSALVYLNRMKQSKPYSTEESTIKRSEQMQNLLAICLSLCRQKVTDETVATNLQETLGDSMTKMQAGNEKTFEDLLSKALPKFVHPAPPPYDQIEKNPSAVSNHNTQVMQLQLNTFLNDIKQQLLNTRIRSYLRIYSSVEISKLANFLEMESSNLTDYLMCYRHKTRHFQTEISFALEKGMIHIEDTRQPKLFQGLFIWFLHKLDHENTELAKIKINTNPDTSKFK